MSNATERLRQAAQNEATSIELNRMLRERDAELSRLAAKLERSRSEVELLRGALLRICKIDTRSKRREFAAAAMSAGEKANVSE